MSLGLDFGSPKRSRGPRWRCGLLAYYPLVHQKGHSVSNQPSALREHARAIWQAGVDAVRPELLLPAALQDEEIRKALTKARRILIMGAGKAGALMSGALEAAVPHCLGKIQGLVNVPAETVRPLQAIQ